MQNNKQTWCYPVLRPRDPGVCLARKSVIHHGSLGIWCASVMFAVSSIDLLSLLDQPRSPFCKDATDCNFAVHTSMKYTSKHSEVAKLLTWLNRVMQVVQDGIVRKKRKPEIPVEKDICHIVVHFTHPYLIIALSLLQVLWLSYGCKDGYVQGSCC